MNGPLDLKTNDLKKFFHAYSQLLIDITKLYETAFENFEDYVLEIQCIVPMMQGYCKDYQRTRDKEFADSLVDDRTKYAFILKEMAKSLNKARRKKNEVYTTMANLSNELYDDQKTISPTIKRYTAFCGSLLSDFEKSTKSFDNYFVEKQFHFLDEITDYTMSLLSVDIDIVDDWSARQKAHFKWSRDAILIIKKLKKNLNKQSQKFQSYSQQIVSKDSLKEIIKQQAIERADEEEKMRLKAMKKSKKKEKKGKRGKRKSK